MFSIVKKENIDVDLNEFYNYFNDKYEIDETIFKRLGERVLEEGY